jgi:hypothetical protein
MAAPETMPSGYEAYYAYGEVEPHTRLGTAGTAQS